MAQNGTPNERPIDGAELLKEFKEAISDLGHEDLKALLPELLAPGSQLVGDPFERTPPPSRRRDRRDDVVTYRVRVDLRGTTPPLWRRLELASDLFLDDVHDVIQEAFGWTDSHLHRFGSGPEYYSPETEYYLCEFEVDEGETGIPEEEVRLDEVLVDVGDKLFYNYDFGDDWEHLIKLEAVLPRENDAPRAVCITGKRPGPAEDCGGVHGYELFAAANDPTHPDQPGAVAELARVYGFDIDPASHAPTPFDLDEINAGLKDIGIDDAQHDAGVSAALTDLLDAVRSTSGRQRLRSLIGQASLDEEVHVDDEAAARMVRPYTWLLDRVGDGIKLTGAGYLPPVHVKAAMTELGMEDEWIGKHNREDQTLPVLELRESAQKVGLLRKYRGKLLLSSRARALRGDPVALWWHLAEHMPLKSKDPSEEQAGLLYLMTAAAGVNDDREKVVAEMLTSIGWMNSDGSALTRSDAAHATFGVRTVLRRLGGIEESGRGIPRTESLTLEGIAFARAALSTWSEMGGSS